MICKCGAKMIAYYRQRDRVFLMECPGCKARKRYDSFEELIRVEQQDRRAR